MDKPIRGEVIEGGSPQHRFMHGAAQVALRIIAEINTGYRTPDEVRVRLEEADVEHPAEHLFEDHDDLLES